MPYIGNTIRAADDYRLIDDISSSFNGSTTSFALQVAGSAPVPFPKSPQQVLISVNGVIQEPDPTGSSGFNLVGTNIVFSSAPTNGHAFFGIIYATADYLNAGGNFPAGSLGAPSLTFIGDENTGIYRKGSGSIGFVADATEIANTDSNGLTISSGNLILGDSSGSSDDRIKLGASGDLQIYHDASHSRIVDSGTGHLIIQTSEVNLMNAAGTEDFIKCHSDGNVEIYFDNSKKFETTNTGVNITGVTVDDGATHDGDVTFTGASANITFDKSSNELLFADNAKASFGNNGDLVIRHDATNSIIEDVGTGPLNIQTNNSNINIKGGSSAGDTMAIFKSTEGVELYFNNSKKAETVTGGFTVTGTCTATAFAGDGSSLTGITSTTINNNANNRIITGSGTANTLEAESNFSFDGSTLSLTGQFNINASATSVQGVVMQNATSNSNADFRLSIKTAANQGADPYIFFDSGGSNMIVGQRYAGTTNNKLVLGAGNNPSSVAGLEIDGNGQITPDSNNARDLGNSSTRFRNIYTNDLNLSNEGSANDFDGTWGSYTIQEGHEDLYLINHRTGKKFKFNLMEVA